ncbi:MAG: NAD(P)-dependent oxidoreductase [Geminicoccales bacterium]
MSAISSRSSSTDLASSPTIGFIGLGQMGHRMARHLAKHGYALVVADANSTKLAPEGTCIVGSNREVGEQADIVILSVPDGKVSLTIAEELKNAPKRKVDLVIDTSTIGIQAARDVAATLAKDGIDFVDAPVSGGIAGAEAASLSVILGCSAALLDRASPILSCLGGRLFHVGEKPGMGQAVKLLNNFLSATAMLATSEALAFGTAEGLDMTTVLDVVNRSTGQNTASRDKFPERIVTERYDGGFAASMMAKDVRLYLDEVTKTGSSAHLAEQVKALWSDFDQSEPGADFTRIYPFIRDGKVNGP